MNDRIQEDNTRMINLSTKIKKINVEPGKRILVTSDIHGYLHYLKKLLEKAKFSDSDILFIVGDMIEKGPDSLGTLRYVMKLCENGNVIPLIGNVDAYRLQIIYSLNESSAPDFFNYVLSLRKWAGASFYEQLCAECGCRCHDFVGHGLRLFVGVVLVALHPRIDEDLLEQAVHVVFFAERFQ